MIRFASVADAEAVASAHRRAGGLEADVADWEQRLAGPYRMLVWDQDGAVAGFVSFGPCEAVDREPEGTGIVMALYVDPAAQGAGVGSALLTASLDAMRSDGLTSAILWVFSDNERARHFYAGHGWTEEPESEQPHSDTGESELRCRISL